MTKGKALSKLSDVVLSCIYEAFGPYAVDVSWSGEYVDVILVSVYGIESDQKCMAIGELVSDIGNAYLKDTRFMVMCLTLNHEQTKKYHPEKGMK